MQSKRPTRAIVPGRAAEVPTTLGLESPGGVKKLFLSDSKSSWLDREHMKVCWVALLLGIGSARKSDQQIWRQVGFS